MLGTDDVLAPFGEIDWAEAVDARSPVKTSDTHRRTHRALCVRARERCLIVFALRNQSSVNDWRRVARLAARQVPEMHALAKAFTRSRLELSAAESEDLGVGIRKATVTFLHGQSVRDSLLNEDL